MRLIEIGLGNIDTTVGAVDANADRVVELAEAMAAARVTVALFPEQAIGGYPPEDLVQWRGFVDRQWDALVSVAARTAELPMVLVVGVVIDHQGLCYNCAAVIAGGVVRALVPKEKLPSYNVFYEHRTISPGSAGLLDEHRGVPFGDLVLEFDFGVMGVEVCEDLWSPEGPIRRRTYAGAELICNLSASPFRIGMLQTRRELISTRAADFQCTLAYTNLIGANDGLVFDGGGWVVQNGKTMLEAPRFERGFSTAVVDLDRTLRLRAEQTTWRADRDAYLEQFEMPATLVIPADEFSTETQRAGLTYPVPAQKSFFLPAEYPAITAREQLCEEVLDALALGVGDYFEKNKAFALIGVSLSGGRDSLLALLIAHRYARTVRPENPGSLIRAFYQPSRFSSEATRTAAQTICADLGVPLTIESIDEAFEHEMRAAEAMLDDGQTLTEITKQNIQARIRAQRMWNWSNSASGLFLQTGNMTEKSVGYTTIGGDLMGALGVLSNVPKTVVIYLLDYLLETRGYPGIAAVLKQPAGPELAPNQRGEDELMPFPILDACLYLFAGEKMTPDEVELVVAELFPELSRETVDGYVAKFVRLFLRSIYKWVQAPLSLHIGNLDLERERSLQLPVVTSSEWTHP